MKMLAPLQAERQLHGIEVVSVPHMTEQARSGLFNRLIRRARREKPKPVAQQLMEHMKVVHTPTPPKEPDGR